MGSAFQHIYHGFHYLGQGNGFHFFPFSLLQPADIQQFVNQPLQAQGFIVDQLAVFFDVFGIRNGSVRNGFIIALDNGNGSPKLVGYVSHKVPAHLFHFFRFQYELFQVPAQRVQGAAQVSNFVVPVYNDLQGIIPRSYGLGAVFHGNQGLDHAFGQAADDNHADNQGDNPHANGVQVNIL